MWDLLRRAGLRILDQQMAPDGITITCECAVKEARSPACGSVSRRRHTARLRRTVSQLVRSHARRTQRLDALLTRIGVFLGGEGGAGLCEELCVPVSPDTIVRLLYRMEPAPTGDWRVLGIDDWAWRRGLHYGTIVCDLETGRTMDILPETQTKNLAQWFAVHRTVEVVTRDRSGVYAAAALGAPQETQVADRWHLLKNLGDVAERVMAGIRLPRMVVEKTRSPTIPSEQVAPPSRETLKDAEQRERHPRRVALYEEIHAVCEKTKSIREVASRLGIDRRTVRRCLDAPKCPLPKPRRKRPSILDPFCEHIVRRRNEGCHNAAELYREIRGLGYRGARTTVKDFVATLRTRDPGKPASRQVRIRLGPRLLHMWFARSPEEFGDTERRWLEGVLEGSPAVRKAHIWLQEFLMILSERRADKLKPWLERASRASVAPLRGFARGVERELDAVMNALTLPWSNSPVEGHINKVKPLLPLKLLPPDRAGTMCSWTQAPSGHAVGGATYRSMQRGASVG